MKQLLIVLAIVLFALTAFAREVWVDGYYRSDGKYVAGHYRTAPDGDRGNNYGSGRGPGYSRDRDRDGTPNYLDRDDNNDGRDDNQNNSLYKRKRRK